MSRNVLTSFKINPNDVTIIEISCRPSGIVNYILTLLKLMPKTILRASRVSFDFEQMTLFRHESNTTPVNHVSTMDCGRAYNWKWLLLAITTFIGGLWQSGDSTASLLFSLILTALFLLFFYLSACFYIGFTPDSGRTYRILFHSSVIGGETVNFEKVKYTCDIMRKIVLAAK